MASSRTCLLLYVKTLKMGMFLFFPVQRTDLHPRGGSSSLRNLHSHFCFSTETSPQDFWLVSLIKQLSLPSEEGTQRAPALSPCLEFSALSLVRPGLDCKDQGEVLPDQCNSSHIPVFPLLGPKSLLKNFSFPSCLFSHLLSHPPTRSLSGHGCWGLLSVYPTRFLFPPPCPFSCREERWTSMSMNPWPT